MRAAPVVTAALFTSIGCLFVAGVVLSVVKTTRYDLILMGHLLSVLSALYVFLYDQAFFPVQVALYSKKASRPPSKRKASRDDILKAPFIP